MRECTFCTISSKTRTVKEYNHWIVQVTDSQQLLGYLVISLKRHAEFFIDVTDDELLEFRDICEDMQLALEENFKPDWYNYQQFGNLNRHLHFYLIPRYKTPREFNGRTFIDERFGKAPERRWIFEEEKFLEKLTNTLRDSLERLSQ